MVAGDVGMEDGLGFWVNERRNVMYKLPDLSFFKNCVFVCVDLQEEPGPVHMREEDMPKEWKALGFSVDDVNKASEYLQSN